MSKLLLSLFLAISFTAGSGPAAQPQTDGTSESIAQRKFVGESVLAERDFPLLAAMLDDVTVRQLLASDPALKLAAATRWKNAADANKECGPDLKCKSKALYFSPQEIDDASAALRRLYRENATLRTFVHAKLVPVSAFALDPAQADESRFMDTWARSARAMNQILSTYCDGTAPRYPEIDAMTYQPESKTYSALITILLDNLAIEEGVSTRSRPEKETLFFEPSLRFSLRLLESNSRDEAGRFWPLETGENAAALKRVAAIDWNRYPYSVIVIPGAGSEVANVSISPWARERVRLGVQAFRTGRAPFIVVSGGFVHPSQTPFCEAVEMKKYLMEIYGIDSSAILLEPYARHTTTNLRNAAREVYNYGLPTDKPMLIVSDDAQIAYIQSDVFLKRTRDELGYLPATLGKRLSSSELEAVPSRMSIYSDATDPLDP